MHHKIKLCVFPMSNNCGEIPIKKKKNNFTFLDSKRSREIEYNGQNQREFNKPA